MPAYEEKFRYEVDVNQEQVKAALDLLEFVGGNAQLALLRGINKSGGKIRTLASAKIREQVRLTANYVTGSTRTGGRPRLYFTKATYKNLTGRISARQRGILTTRYSTDPELAKIWQRDFYQVPRQPDAIKVKIKPKGKTYTYDKDWFYLLLNNSDTIAIARHVGGNEGPRDQGYEIAYGPSLSQVFKQIKEQKIDPTAQRYFREETLNQIDLLIKKELR